jgi:hypothetical protein
MMTKRLRAGVMVLAEIHGQNFYFGYLTHPGLEYEIAIAFDAHQLDIFTTTNKVMIDPDDDMYRFGLLLQQEDSQDNDVFTAKVHIDHKFKNLAIYASQYEELIKKGFEVNSVQEAAIIEKISLNL